MTVTRRNDGTVELVCTEREARFTAFLHSVSADEGYRNIPVVPSGEYVTTQGLRALKVISERCDDIARAIYNVVGI